MVYALMFVLALVCSVLASYVIARGKRSSWLHSSAFAMLKVGSVYAFLKIEYPRLGVVQFLDESDQVLVELGGMQ